MQCIMAIQDLNLRILSNPLPEEIWECLDNFLQPVLQMIPKELHQHRQPVRYLSQAIILHPASQSLTQVNNGQFDVDMAFEEDPVGLRRGQTMQVKLTLGDNADAILIPNGSFYQETGGNWIFVVSADGTEAVKRTVRLGRRNTDFIEVLDGLEPGEKVITSPYTSYVGMDRLTLD